MMSRRRAAIVACCVVAVAALAVPAVDGMTMQKQADRWTRFEIRRAADHWHNLVATGSAPGEATDVVLERLHDRTMGRRGGTAEIPFLQEVDFDALHSAFRLNPFIETTKPRLASRAEERELREVMPSVRAIEGSLRNSELVRQQQQFRRLLWYGLAVFALAGISALWLLQPQWLQQIIADLGPQRARPA